MNKYRFLIFISIGLFISNILLICFLFSKKQGPPSQVGPRNIIIEKLQFDKNQTAEYDKLILAHQEAISSNQKEIMRLKNQLYGSMINDVQVLLKDSLITKMNKVQLKIENIHYNHFQDIKKLCNDEQHDAFANLTKEIAKLFAPHPMKEKKK